MQDPAPPNINSWLEDELLSQYKYDRKTVDHEWAPVFDANGFESNGTIANSAAANGDHTATAQLAPPTRVTEHPAPAVSIGEHDQVTPLRGPALRIAENMAASLTIPVATSIRTIPVKVMEENRRLINQ